MTNEARPVSSSLPASLSGEQGAVPGCRDPPGSCWALAAGLLLPAGEGTQGFPAVLLPRAGAAGFSPPPLPGAGLQGRGLSGVRNPSKSGGRRGASECGGRSGPASAAVCSLAACAACGTRPRASLRKRYGCLWACVKGPADIFQFIFYLFLLNSERRRESRLWVFKNGVLR